MVHTKIPGRPPFGVSLAPVIARQGRRPLIPLPRAEEMSRADCRRELDSIEPEPRIACDRPRHVADAVSQRARDMGWERELQRARLVQADVQIRWGQGATGMQTAQVVATWAEKRGDDYVLARARRVQSGYFWRFGDSVEALEAALDCHRLLPPDAPVAVRIEHFLAQADVLSVSESFQRGFSRYIQVIQECRRYELHALRVAALNNYAFSLWRQDRKDEARERAAEMIAITRAHDVPMQPHWVETIARFHLESGELDHAIRMLRDAISECLDSDGTEVVGIADCQLCLAEALRQHGDFDEAMRALDECQNLIAEYELTHPEIALLLERGRLHAARGDFRQAYAAQQQAFQRLDESRSAEIQARTSTLVVLHDTMQAREDSSRFRRLSYVDALTGLGNRRFVMEALAAGSRRSAELDRPLAIALFDLDHFKSVNDSWSHEVGDRVLQAIGSLLASATGMPLRRPGDLTDDAEAPWQVDVEASLDNPGGSYAARLGGEEFLVVLPDASPGSASAFVDGVLAAIRRYDWSLLLPHGGVTASVGVVVSRGNVRASQLLRGADELLYLAKEQGRDRMVGPGMIPATE